MLLALLLTLNEGEVCARLLSRALTRRVDVAVGVAVGVDKDDETESGSETIQSCE